jgi:hypothetical protein
MAGVAHPSQVSKRESVDVGKCRSAMTLFTRSPSADFRKLKTFLGRAQARAKRGGAGSNLVATP